MNRINRPDAATKAKPARRATTLALACGLLLVAPSCMIPAARNPKPGPGVPPTYDLKKQDPESNLPPVFEAADSPENSARLRVEEFYDDPTLVGLIRTSIQGNQELRVISEDIQIASNEIMSRRGAYLPFINPSIGSAIEKTSLFTINGVGIRNNPFAPGMFLPDPYPNYFLAPAEMLLKPDLWWGMHNAKNAAVLRYYAAAEARNYFVTQLIGNVATEYYNLMGLDQRITILNETIAIMELSLEQARTIKEGARGTELPVQRFLAEVRKTQSEKQILSQDIVETENRINFLLGRNPQRVERMAGDFIDLNPHRLDLGVPAEMLRNRPDIRQAERALLAAGLDVKAARKQFYPQGLITGNVGWSGFDPRFLFITPEGLIAGAAGSLMVPVVNRKAIKAEYLSANARQLQAVYTYQRVVLEAFVELVNNMSKVDYYRQSITIKRQELAALEEAVRVAMGLFQFARADYVDVLFAQRDLRDARLVIMETKQQELGAVVRTYQALGGGAYIFPIPVPRPQRPFWERIRTHWTPAEDVTPAPIGEPANPAVPKPPMSQAAEPFVDPLGTKPDAVPPPPSPDDADQTPPTDRIPVPSAEPAADGPPEPLPTPMEDADAPAPEAGASP